jgi:hypothetical protein
MFIAQEHTNQLENPEGVKQLKFNQINVSPLRGSLYG